MKFPGRFCRSAHPPPSWRARYVQAQFTGADAVDVNNDLTGIGLMPCWKGTIISNRSPAPGEPHRAGSVIVALQAPL